MKCDIRFNNLAKVTHMIKCLATKYLITMAKNHTLISFADTDYEILAEYIGHILYCSAKHLRADKII